MSATAKTAREVFVAAVKLAPEEWDAYLTDHCGADDELRQRVRNLLCAHAEAGSFLQSPAGPATNVTVDAPIGERPGMVIGPYKLLEQIGEGGFGVVFMAEQTAPLRRKVALKVIKPGMDTRQVIARFEAERQALALMDHPNIAHVLDAGETDSGRPYFVMELIRGIPITEYCDKDQLTPRARLELFLSVCQAVQHAHQKGIIHRDLKPSNVLVTLHDGTPVVKIIDFGIAKATGQQLTDKTLFTNFAHMIGTPLYMSPEQAEMSGLDVDTRSDIYSLGVLLYELLTGTTPFDKQRLKHAAFDEIRRIIREEEPVRPSTRMSEASRSGELSGTDGAMGPARLAGPTSSLTSIAANRKSDPKKLSQLFRGELDWIVMKALDKDRRRRYETASGLARDIEHYLHDEAVEACPPSALYRFGKFVRRNKVVLTTVALVAVALIAGTAISVWQAVRAIQAENLVSEQLDETKEAHKATEVAREEALADRNAALEHLYLAQTHVAQFAHAEGNIGRLLNVLEAQRPRPNQTDLRGWEWYYLRACAERNVLTLRGHTGPVRVVAWSPDGKQLASAGDDGAVRLWEAGAGRMLRSWVAHAEKVLALCWSPDGKRLATVGGDGTVEIWDARAGTSLRILADAQEGERGVHWSADGTRLATWGSRLGVQLWNPDTGERLHILVHTTASPQKPGQPPLGRTVTYVSAAAFSPDGKWLASTDRAKGRVHLHDVETGKLLMIDTTVIIAVAPFCLVWSPNGQEVAAGTRIVDVASWKHRYSLLSGQPPCFAVAWGSRKNQVAIATLDAFVRVYDATTGQEALVLPRQAKAVLGLSWSPDGRYLASAGGDHTVKVWEASNDPVIRKWPVRAPELPQLARHPRRGWVVSHGWGKGLNVWDGPTGKELFVVGLEERLTARAWSEQGQLATGSEDGTVRVWDGETGKERLLIRGHQRQAGSVAWSPDGLRLASASSDGIVKVWDPETGTELAVVQAHKKQVAVAWRPDGTKFASSSEDATVQVWDAGSGHELLTLRGPPEGMYRVAWSQDGTRLAGAAKDSTIVIWDAQDGKVVHTLRGHTQWVITIAWTKDNRRLASASGDGTVKIWDASLGQELLTLRDMRGPALSLLWSDDGRQLHAAARREILTWDASLGYGLQAAP